MKKQKKETVFKNTSKKVLKKKIIFCKYINNERIPRPLHTRQSLFCFSHIGLCYGIV
jgi:hypothetical protein